MYFKINIIFYLLSFPIFLQSQTNEVLFTINNKETSKTTFLRSLSKNNQIDYAKNKDSLRKYLDQYIDFKLKVIEAENQGFDRAPEFKDEFEKYSEKLSQPYLIDQEMVHKLAEEAYERMKTEVKLRQILVRIDPNASPVDSLIAYQKTLKILKRLSNAESFDTLAKQVSDDPQAVINGGNLWYIGPFVLPYNLENYIYSANQRKYSNPIRTNLGYHIVEILDKRKNPGRFKVAHILFSSRKELIEQGESKAKQLADSIYQLIKKGEDFAKLALKYSDDKGTSANGGELQWFESGMMPHEFELECIGLKEIGSISKPIKTRFGWHIIKMISREDIPDYEQIEEQLLQKVSSGDRGEIAVNKTLDRLKKEYHFNDLNALSPLVDFIDSTVFMGEWRIPDYVDLSGILFSFGKQKYTQEEFAKYIVNTQKEMFPIPIINYIDLKYNEFIKKELLSYEKKMLENKDRHYQELINEYREGILYFKIMKKEVWDKANDTIGLADYYSKNKDKYNKLYEADVSIFNYNSSESSKIERMFRKLKKTFTDDYDIVSNIQSSIDKDFKLIWQGFVTEGENDLIDKCLTMFKSGDLNKDEKIIVFDNEKKLVWFNSEIRKTDKTINDTKGVVMADYQKYIEKNWISNLRKFNRIVVNETVFDSLTN